MTDEKLRAAGILVGMIVLLVVLAFLILSADECLDYGTGFCPA